MSGVQRPRHCMGTPASLPSCQPHLVTSAPAAAFCDPASRPTCPNLPSSPPCSLLPVVAGNPAKLLPSLRYLEILLEGACCVRKGIDVSPIVFAPPLAVQRLASCH